MIFTMMSTPLFSQTLGSGIFFQAIARDNFSNPAKDRKIYIQSSIIQTTATGTVVLMEQHQATTDLTGVFSISIGQGIKTGGTAANLTSIDWSKGPYYLNLKVSITPVAPIAGWDYTKDWVDLGTTSFGAVPYALYAASAGGVDQKVSFSDTAKMLLPYAKNSAVTNLATSLATKLTASDTAAMLTNYAKTNIVTALALAAATKLNAIDTASLSSRINLKANLADVNTSLATKANAADVTTSLALKANLASPTFTGTLTAGDVTYPNAHGTNGQVLTTTGTGALTWATPASSANASSLTGVVAVANGGTGQTTVPGILTTLGFSSNNVAIGNLAGTPGIGVNANNVAIGGGAGKTAQGQSSISIGYVAGYANQGVNSLAIGGNAAQSSQGTQAVALGYAAGQNSQGANSVALGAFAGNSQVANSIAINASGANLNPTNAGFYVNPVRATTATSSLLYYNTSTKEITSGASSGVDLTTAQTIGGAKTFSNNVNINGVSVGPYNGISNTMVGNNAFLNSTPGVNNTAIGSNALSNAIGGNDNTAIGSKAIAGLGLATGSGWRNTAVGVSALENGGGGSDNVAVGFLTLPNTTGGANTAVGMYALLSNTTATENVAVGAYAQYNTTVGINNTSIGTMSMALNTSGTQNTVLGASAIEKNILGSNNTVLGFSAGKVIADNSTVNSNVDNSVLIGALSKTLAVNSNNEVVIGYNAVGNGSNTVTLGNSDISNVKTSGTITAGAVTYPKVDGTNGQVLTTNGSGVTSWTSVSSGASLSIGDTYQGGIIFWLDASGKHGLIAAATDQSTGVRWDAGTNTNTMAYGGKRLATSGRSYFMMGISNAGGIGGGKSNTTIIISNQGYGDGSTYAARICNEYYVTSGAITYEDWYLPSIDELNLMDLKIGSRSLLGNVANFTTAMYWSSSENDQNTAISHHMNGGMEMSNSKTTLNSVRAIRAF